MVQKKHLNSVTLIIS